MIKNITVYAEMSFNENLTGETFGACAWLCGDHRAGHEILCNGAVDVTLGRPFVTIRRMIVCVARLRGVAEKIVAKGDLLTICPRSDSAGNNHERTADNDEQSLHCWALTCLVAQRFSRGRRSALLS